MKVYLDTIGCRLNQGEVERMARQFRQAGHTLVSDPAESDIAVVNTCTVTAAAAADSRSCARRVHRTNPRARIVLTGCWSSLEPEQAAKLPGVADLVHNQDKDDLVAHVLQIPPQALDPEPPERTAAPGSRMRTRAFIKVQDGCDHHCTFCLTTIARGPARSVPVDHVVDEINATVADGVREAVITGVSLSAYGRELPGKPSLTTLVSAILEHTVVPRLRLSSIEPWGIPEGFFELWQDERLCRQLHLPLQSGCDATLRRMGRPMRTEAYHRLISHARTAIPGLAVTTDLIAGFPGETEEEFRQSTAFVEAMTFAGAHIFTYSPRPNTAASRLPGRVSRPVARARSQRLHQIAQRAATDFRRVFIGEEVTVLWERSEKTGPDGWSLNGLTDNYLRVHSLAARGNWNQLSQVRLTELTDDGLKGVVIGHGVDGLGVVPSPPRDSV